MREEKVSREQGRRCHGGGEASCPRQRRRSPPGDGAFIHDDMPECQVLWEMATESVFELADKLDDSDNKK